MSVYLSAGAILLCGPAVVFAFPRISDWLQTGWWPVVAVVLLVACTVAGILIVAYLITRAAPAGGASMARDCLISGVSGSA